MDHQQWNQFLQDAQYAQYLAYAGLAPASAFAYPYAPQPDYNPNLDVQLLQYTPQDVESWSQGIDSSMDEAERFALVIGRASNANQTLSAPNYHFEDPTLAVPNLQFSDQTLSALNQFADRLTASSAAHSRESTDYVELPSNLPTTADLRGDETINADLFTMPFKDMQNAHIGVEAVYYLQCLIDTAPAHEPLLAALGGDPIALKKNIEAELDLWKSNGMTPVFVFEGQATVGKEEVALQKAKAGLVQTQEAWDLYADNQPEAAVVKFGASGAIRAQDLCRILQEVLAERKLDFIIAPFSACAQLAYLESLNEPYIDGVMGSQELLLYNIDDAVIYPPSAADWESKTFSGVVKSEIIKKLGVTPDLFQDALLMIGRSFLPFFPPLLDNDLTQEKTYNITNAINQLRTSEKSIANACAGFSDILARTEPNWLDKFRKAKMGIKHCVTVQLDGTINIRDYENLTSDNVEYLGLQLPPELYHYFSKGMIGPRLMNSFVSLESWVFPTLDGVLSDEYRRLVTSSLPPLKEATASLISTRIHRGFHYKDIIMKAWFDPNLQHKLHPRNVSAQMTQRADAWGVKDAASKTRESTIGVPAGKLTFALLALQDKEFATKSISKEKVTNLSSKPEIISNALWRLLNLRGYTNDQHELTSWGKALAITLKAINPSVKKYGDIHHVEEAAFLAFELIHFDSLNSRNRHTELIGGPLRGSDADKENCILIGRTSSLLKLRHHPIGYTGPLSKNLLAFHSLIKAVRETDRDFLEAITASMFLNGQVNRNRNDFGDIGRSLPFATDVDIGLGIAVKTYLDDFLRMDLSPEAREAEKSTYVSKYLPHSVNFVEDLDVAFKFFDAVYAGVSSLGSEINEADKKSWDNAKVYLDKRR